MPRDPLSPTAQNGDSDPPLLLSGGMVFDGESSRLLRADVLVAGDRIAVVAPGLKPNRARTLDSIGCTILPGLIDCHVHLTQAHEDQPHFEAEEIERPALRWREGVRWAAAMLAAGYTTVRDLGGAERLNITLARAIEAGDISGPTIVACGWRIAPYAIGNVGGLPPEPNTIVDHLSRGVHGTEAVRHAVLEEIAAGAAVVKLYGHTRRFGRDGTPLEQFTLGELATATDTAHAHRRRVAIHTFIDSVTNRALDAGVDSIEHGTTLADATLERMAATGTYFCPTISALQYWHLYPEAIPERLYSQRLLDRIDEIQAELIGTVARARRAGVRIVAGSDQRGARFPLGRNALEIEYLSTAGLPVADALSAATARAADLVTPGELRGRVQPGHRADLVVVAGNPLSDVTLLQRSQAIRAVIKGGVVQSDGSPCPAPEA